MLTEIEDAGRRREGTAARARRRRARGPRRRRKAPLRLLLQKKYLGPTIAALRAVGDPDHRLLRLLELGADAAGPSRASAWRSRSSTWRSRRSARRWARFLAALVTDRFERKWCLVVFGTVIAVCGLLYGLTFNPILIVVFGFLVNLFERGYTALAYAYSPELFDTRGRSLGTGVSYGLGRLSNAVGPLIIAALYNGVGYQSVFIFIAGTWLFGAIVLAVFGPRTRRALEHPFAAAKSTPTTA